MTDKSKPEALTDEDLDGVQGAGARSYVKQTATKGVVLSSETQEPSKGIVVSSESETTYLTGKDPSEGVVLSSESETPYLKKR